MAMSEREQGQEDVLEFIRKGRFLHDESPPAKFAREIEKGWRLHGKATAEAAANAKPTQFRKEIEMAINRYSMENGSDTPDFILAEFLTDCLVVFDKATRAREQWYGRGREPVTPATVEELNAILNAPAPDNPVEITPDGKVREVRNVDAKLHPERYFNPETGDKDF
jgi:hypothetical protein